MRRVAFIFLVLFLVYPSCSQRSSFPPVGSYSNVMLVTEDGLMSGPVEEMIRLLQHPIDYYTKLELQFKVRLVSVEQMRKETPSKNTVIFGLAGAGETGRVIEGSIGGAAVRTVLEGRNHIFKRLNYPATGQLTLIVAAGSWDRLKKVIRENGEMIRDIIEEANRERLREYLLRKEKSDVSELLRAKYGFTVRVPFLYELNSEKPDVPGVELVRTKPHRGLTVSWRSWKKGSLSIADSLELYDTRLDIAWKMYDKDVMRPELVFYREDQLDDYPAVRMDGYWENSIETHGGPFTCYFILDRVKKRLWIVDCLVYAPGFDKHVLLRELRAVAETFRIN